MKLKNSLNRFNSKLGTVKKKKKKLGDLTTYNIIIQAEEQRIFLN